MFTLNDIEHLAHTLYGLKASATPLPGEVDLNFRLEDRSGKSYTFKIAHPGASIENLEMQNAAIRHLALVQFHLYATQFLV